MTGIKYLPPSGVEFFRQKLLPESVQQISNIAEKAISNPEQLLSDLNSMAVRNKTVLDKPFKLRVWAHSLHNTANLELENILSVIKGIVPQDTGIIVARVKDPVSIAEKFHKVHRNYGILVNSLEHAKSKVTDLVGTRIVLHTGSANEIDNVVSSLVEAILDNKVNIKELRNYSGPNFTPYLTDDHMKMIQDAAMSSGQNPIVKKETRSTGYTGCHFLFEFNKGVITELQLKGSKTNNYHTFNHLIYDIMQGKNPSKKIPELEKLLEPLVTSVKSFTNEDKNKYDNYLINSAKYFRLAECGIDAELPILPEGMDKILSLDNIESLYKEYSLILEKHKK
ncbi:MAG: hypothetical protein WCK67_05115 [bacterium]